ncbi:glycosyltransferase family 2 protein [Halobellus sp. H-GB7]|uniref:glycosyltransferase family 2 protein n=1 Tax=Halobellus sp. H-GB7 TaxID=3069756 RepID=UPI0027B84ADF|nr:glycosyltransferase family 2 protein [Halobellus sp. H-GB7]MDQ2056435.1 glycosyltransferase family 2 protein [Halobellus sp. H-GB7]
MRTSPTVSVVIPYGPKFTPNSMLERAKQSAKAQQIPVEIIVVTDDQSHGPAWARNRGLEQAETRYVAFLDADDRWNEDKLKRQLDRMDSTGAGLCVEAPDISKKTFMCELYLGNIESLTSSILIDTEQIAIRFDEVLERREDHLFILEAAAAGDICTCEDLFEVERHGESLSSGMTHTYRLKKDKEFAIKVKQQVPEVREYINEEYRYVACDGRPFMNTAGDVYRALLLGVSYYTLANIFVSFLCQKLLK